MVAIETRTLDFLCPAVELCVASLHSDRFVFNRHMPWYWKRIFTFAIHALFLFCIAYYFLHQEVPFVAALLVVNCSRTVSYTLSFLIDYIRLLRPLYCICLLEIPNSVLRYALKTYILKMRKLYITPAIMRLSRLLLVFHYHSRMFNIIV